MIFQIIIVVITNYIFIPLYGITGAAFATLVSKFIIDFIRYLIVLIMFKLQPYNMKFLVVLIFSAISFAAGYIIPEFDNYIIDIIVRSAVIAVIFVILILGFRISEDINLVYLDLRKKLKF